MQSMVLVCDPGKIFGDSTESTRENIIIIFSSYLWVLLDDGDFQGEESLLFSVFVGSSVFILLLLLDGDFQEVESLLFSVVNGSSFFCLHWVFFLRSSAM